MRRLLLTIALAATLAVAPAALAAGSSPVADCNAHARLTEHYTVAELRRGLATMPADIREYTDCYDVLQRTLLAQLGQLHSSGSGGGSGGSFLPTPVLIAVIVLVVAAAGLGTVALRRRQ
jgi:hypothetical protein